MTVHLLSNWGVLGLLSGLRINAAMYDANLQQVRAGGLTPAAAAAAAKVVEEHAVLDEAIAENERVWGRHTQTVTMQQPPPNSGLKIMLCKRALLFRGQPSSWQLSLGPKPLGWHYQELLFTSLYDELGVWRQQLNVSAGGRATRRPTGSAGAIAWASKLGLRPGPSCVRRLLLLRLSLRIHIRFSLRLRLRVREGAKSSSTFLRGAGRRVGAHTVGGADRGAAQNQGQEGVRMWGGLETAGLPCMLPQAAVHLRP